MIEDDIRQFLSGKHFAVAGASQDRAKYGNKVLRAYLQNRYDVVAIHPSATSIEGVPAYAKLADVPHAIDGLSIVTPPPVTEKIVAEAIASGIKHIWMQPGAESDAAIQAARDAGVRVIAGGPCVLVALHFRES